MEKLKFRCMGSILFWSFFAAIMVFFSACRKEEPEIKSGTFIDHRDNREYKWVKIGNQIWMAENFAYAPIISPDKENGGIWLPRFTWIIPNMDSAAKAEIRNTRGCLYNWEKAMELCPEGWRLPSDEDWIELERFLGMKQEELFLEGERGVSQRIGGKLKDTGTTYWDPPNMGATNETGFTARPCGHHNFFAWYPDGSFRFYDDYFDEVAFYWTSTTVADSAYVRYLDDSRYGIFRRKFMKSFGYSVRYIQNN